MKLNKPIVFFDLETTGVDITKDRIVEVSCLKVNIDGSKKVVTHRVNPLIPIDPKATAVHGITNDDVKDKPTFKQISKSFREWLDGCDMAGFNSNRFDVPLLVEEFARSENPLDLSNTNFIDIYTIFVKNEERTLSAAYKFYCGEELENAHSAEADILASYEVFMAQMEKYNLPDSIEEIQNMYDDRSKLVDFARKFTRNDAGEIVFNFGKYKGEVVTQVLKKNRGYYTWMMEGEFTSDTKHWLNKIVKNEA